MADTKRIEEEAVDAVKRVIRTVDLLSAYISDNDKGPCCVICNVRSGLTLAVFFDPSPENFSKSESAFPPAEDNNIPPARDAPG